MMRHGMMGCVLQNACPYPNATNEIALIARRHQISGCDHDRSCEVFRLIGSNKLVTATIIVRAPRKSMRLTRSTHVISLIAGGRGMSTFHNMMPMHASMIGTLYYH